MYSAEVAEIVGNVWQSLLEFDIQLIDEPGPASRSQWALTGCIQITGAWRASKEPSRSSANKPKWSVECVCR